MENFDESLDKLFQGIQDLYIASKKKTGVVIIKQRFPRKLKKKIKKEGGILRPKGVRGDGLVRMPKSYSGNFFIDIPTESIIKKPETIDQLNSISSSIVNKKDHITSWSFEDLNKALQAVLLLQNTKIPFTMLGEQDQVFIIQEA